MKLKTISVKAKTVRDACEIVENGAGREEYEYLSAHPDEFPELKDGNYYFFTGAASDDDVPVARWGGTLGGFIFRDYLLRSGWLDDDRAVLRDLDSPSDTGTMDLEHLLSDLESLVKKYRV